MSGWRFLLYISLSAVSLSPPLPPAIFKMSLFIPGVEQLGRDVCSVTSFVVSVLGVFSALWFLDLQLSEFGKNLRYYLLNYLSLSLGPLTTTPRVTVVPFTVFTPLSMLPSGQPLSCFQTHVRAVINLL